MIFIKSLSHLTQLVKCKSSHHLVLPILVAEGERVINELVDMFTPINWFKWFAPPLRGRLIGFSNVRVTLKNFVKFDDMTDALAG